MLQNAATTSDLLRKFLNRDPRTKQAIMKEIKEFSGRCPATVTNFLSGRNAPNEATLTGIQEYLILQDVMTEHGHPKGEYALKNEPTDTDIEQLGDMGIKTGVRKQGKAEEVPMRLTKLERAYMIQGIMGCGADEPSKDRMLRLHFPQL